MIRVMQLNIDRGRDAHDLLLATADLLMVQECNRSKSRNSGFWLDNGEDAAIGITGKWCA